MTTHKCVILLVSVSVASGIVCNSYAEGLSKYNDAEYALSNKCQEIIRSIDNSESASDILGVKQLGAEYESLQFVEKDDLGMWMQYRQNKLTLWIKALSALRARFEPAFNPDDEPQMNVSPPQDSGLDAGVSPAAINDPKMRREYEETLKHNSNKLRQYSYQSKLRALDAAWTEKILAYILCYYSTSTQDMTEVAGILLTCGKPSNSVTNRIPDKMTSGDR